MSFGEHLEELRGALFKALLALVVGTVGGLVCGRWVVGFIQTPLKEALHEHFQGRAEQQELERLEQLKAAGKPVPDDLPKAAREFAELEVAPKEFLVAPHAILEALHRKYPDAVDLDQLPPTPGDAVVGKEDLVRLKLYQPLAEDSRLRVIGLSAHEPFMVYLKASLVAGALFASPLIFYFVWDFVAAGLYRHERKYIYLYLPISLGLFLAGAALAFFVAFDFVLDFLFKFYAWTGTDPSPRLSEWISFVLMLPLGFGISFQLPLVMLLLERLGICSVGAYLSKWRLAVLIISVLSMFLTPADPGSMIVMGVPLVALYFGGIALCHFMPGAGPQRAAEDASDDMGS